MCPQGGAHRTSSLSSLNSQDSSNDISRLTDKQQAEYRSAYQEYVAQMAQLETGGTAERPVQPQPGQFMTPSSSEDKSKDEQDGRKSFAKRSGAKPAPDGSDFTSGGDALDPITEEDEKDHHGSSKSLLTRKLSAERGGLFQGAADLKVKASGGQRYQKLTSDDEESEESDNPPPMKDGKTAVEPKPPGGSLALKGKDYLSDAVLDKKDSSDSGVRSNESSPNHSLQDEEADLSQLERANLIELDEDGAAKRRGLPSSLSGLQDPAVTRMSICSEDQCSLLASSPEESWTSSKSYNLNVTLNNNANAQQGTRPRPPTEGPASSNKTSSGDVISPPSSTRPGPNNENVRVVHLKRGLKPGDPPEVCTVSSDTVTFGEERESIL